MCELMEQKILIFKNDNLLVHRWSICQKILIFKNINYLLMATKKAEYLKIKIMNIFLYFLLKILDKLFYL